MSISATGNGPIDNNFYSRSSGTGSTEPFITALKLSDPTQYDINYPITKRWINTVLIKEWYLQNYFNADGVLYANWVLLSTGGSQPLFRVGVDTNTAPGTNPVVPDVTGKITINGAQVASGTTTNAIRTDSISLNQFNIEIQRTTTAATSTVGLNGIAHFDVNDFTVDANGFVQANGTGLVKWNIITASQTLAVNNGYICTANTLTLIMPASPALGDIVEVVNDGSTSITVQLNTGQTMRFGNLASSAGPAGNLLSTVLGVTLRMVAQSSTRWNVLDGISPWQVT